MPYGQMTLGGQDELGQDLVMTGPSDGSDGSMGFQELSFHSSLNHEFSACSNNDNYRTNEHYFKTITKSFRVKMRRTLVNVLTPSGYP